MNLFSLKIKRYYSRTMFLFRNKLLMETMLPASSNSTSPQTTQDALSPFEPTYDADGNQTLVHTSTGTGYECSMSSSEIEHKVGVSLECRF